MAADVKSAPPLSWNRIPRVRPERTVDLTSRSHALPDLLGDEDRLLPYGNGRSYGDVCLIENGTLLRTRGLDHFIAFDRVTGRLRCEAGVLIGDILELVVPQGWFLPVTPGTRYVTVGGAIANDVHGKNHHAQGSFGEHVRALELLRSSGERMVCGPDDNAGWFSATVGGLGLTGLITWAELQLLPVSNDCMVTETFRFGNLDEFWVLNATAAREWPYTVAWVDCLASSRKQGRGVFIAADHAPQRDGLPSWRDRPRRFPFDPPFSLVNGLSLRAFNAVYYAKAPRRKRCLSHYVPYFYPLDGVREWNRMYGRAGFYQYQCVLPPAAMREGVRELLRRIARGGEGSFLAVLKTFGDRAAPGMLSFARAGATLALDFPNRGERTSRLFRELDAVVLEAGGALYPAKDARMPAEMFRAGFPQWEDFKRFTDPAFSSNFWRRVSQ